MPVLTRAKAATERERLQLLESVALPRPSFVYQEPRTRRTIPSAVDSASEDSDFVDSLPAHLHLSALWNRNCPRPTRSSCAASPPSSPYLPITGDIRLSDVKELEMELRLVRCSRSKRQEHCAVCLETFGGANGRLMKWPCPPGQQHTFHFTCSRKSLLVDRRCPVCRHSPFSIVQPHSHITHSFSCVLYCGLASCYCSLVYCGLASLDRKHNRPAN